MLLATAAASEATPIGGTAAGKAPAAVAAAAGVGEHVAPPFFVSLAAGAAAGIAVDVSLFPIDTIKTRMQTKEGFFKAGGFRGIYNGLGVAALGSAPGAAAFFTV